ncbi:TadE/TadG family type IV pilus assembly protein [Chitinimonas sp.]|uniref:TadE/TadG family type IV pilus assembly protein n=1 Tax=Chitinimonas sp. TaxID=1934313 RepID=UPI0035B4BEFD
MPRSHLPHPAYLKNQRGQALVFSLLTAVVVILVLFATYNVGQQALAKMRLQNAADNTAYSVAIVQARDYNFSAYTNRAMVANQVSVAQVVGLTSWARNYREIYNGDFSWVAETMTSLGGPLNFLWKVPAPIMKTASNVFAQFMGMPNSTGAGKIVVTTLEVLIDTLRISQTVSHYGTALTVAQMLGMTDMADLMSRLGLDSFIDIDWSSDPAKSINNFLSGDHNIIRDNLATARLSVPGWIAGIGYLAQWVRFTETKDPNLKAKDGEEADRFGKVTINSLDYFSRDRSTKHSWMGFEGPYVSPAIVDPTVLIPTVNGVLTMFLWHRGGTELKAVDPDGVVKRTWTALDATGLFGVAIIWITLPIPPFFIPIVIPAFPIPVGHGAAQSGVEMSGSAALSDSNDFDLDDASKAYGGAYRGWLTAVPAYLQQSQGAGKTLTMMTLGGKGGLRSYQDVKKVDKDNLSAPPLILEIEMAGTDIKTSNSVTTGRFAMQAGTRSNAMRALSKAQAYFARPTKLWKRDDNKTELGSLYNPYWQAQLLPNSFAERYVSMAYQWL